MWQKMLQTGSGSGGKAEYVCDRVSGLVSGTPKQVSLGFKPSSLMVTLKHSMSAYTPVVYRFENGSFNGVSVSGVDWLDYDYGEIVLNNDGFTINIESDRDNMAFYFALK